jgi:NADH-quinone oxidoreductase subunit N
MCVLLLSQLGAPLTSGFYAKYSVLASTIDVGGSPLALIALLSAAIAACFYLRWSTALYSDEPVEATRIVVPLSTGIVIGVGVAMTLVFGIWPGPLVTLCQHATLLFTP